MPHVQSVRAIGCVLLHAARQLQHGTHSLRPATATEGKRTLQCEKLCLVPKQCPSQRVIVRAAPCVQRSVVRVCTSRISSSCWQQIPVSLHIQHTFSRCMGYTVQPYGCHQACHSLLQASNLHILLESATAEHAAPRFRPPVQMPWRTLLRMFFSVVLLAGLWTVAGGVCTAQ